MSQGQDGSLGSYRNVMASADAMTTTVEQAAEVNHIPIT
jgi:hypothetical protein